MLRIASTDDRPTPELIDFADVCKILGLSRTAAHRLLAAGKIPPPKVKLNQRVRRWDKRELIEWIDAGCPRFRNKK